MGRDVFIEDGDENGRLNRSIMITISPPSMRNAPDTQFDMRRTRPSMYLSHSLSLALARSLGLALARSLGLARSLLC
jgi:hypothetical protein